MKIGDRVFVRGYIDEIRKDTVIIRNAGGYFGTIPSEVITGELPSAQPEPNCSEIPNNSDTISRQAAIDALRKMQTYKLFSGDDMLLIDQAGAMTELMLLPIAQSEIIRCKDCKYGVVDDPEIPFLRFCEYNGQDWNDENHYCGHAERKEVTE